MNYGEIIDGTLHVYAGPGDGRKPIQDNIPEGYTKDQCQEVPGGYKDLGDTIGREYVYVAPGTSLTEQRLAGLEEQQAVTDAAVQELILATMGRGE